MRRSHGLAFALRLVVVVALALVLTGCHRSDGLPKEEWVEQVSALCEQQWEDSVARAKEAQEEQPSDFDEAIDQSVQQMERELFYVQVNQEKLRELGLPEGDERAFREFLDQSEQSFSLLEQYIEALRERDGLRALRLSEEFEASGMQGGARARELGIDECARLPVERLR